MCDESDVDKEFFPFGQEIDWAVESQSSPSAIVSRETLKANSREQPRQAEIW